GERGKAWGELRRGLGPRGARRGGDSPAPPAGPGATRASGSAVTGAVRPPARVPPARGDAMASAPPPVAAAPVASPPSAIAIAPAVSDESVATAGMAARAHIAGDLVERRSLVPRRGEARKGSV